MKIGLQLEFLHFQVDRGLICINVVLIFHENHNLLKIQCKNTLDILKTCPIYLFISFAFLI